MPDFYECFIEQEEPETNPDFPQVIIEDQARDDELSDKFSQAGAQLGPHAVEAATEQPRHGIRDRFNVSGYSAPVSIGNPYAGPKFHQVL